MPDRARELSGITDFHNHVMPGVDDGAQSVDDAVAALRARPQSGWSSWITAGSGSRSLPRKYQVFACIAGRK